MAWITHVFFVGCTILNSTYFNPDASPSLCNSQQTCMGDVPAMVQKLYMTILQVKSML